MSIETKIGMFGNPSSEFFISANEINNMLETTASQEADHWPLRSSSLLSFSQKIEKLFVVSNGGFTFQATWQGEPTTEVRSLSIAEFLEVIRSNSLGKKTKYVVVGTV